MPANLPPQYYDLERQYRDSRDREEKLRLLEQMLREIPKHKGTTHLQGELKSKIGKMKKERPKKHGATHQEMLDHVEKEGAAQIVLVGGPNTGKSAILAALTHARPEIADYPCTTRRPLAGMTHFENVPFQLIDTPPILPDTREKFVFSLMRKADLVCPVVSLAQDDLLETFDDFVQRTTSENIILDGIVDVDRAPRAGPVVKKSRVIATGLDDSQAQDRLAIWREMMGDCHPVLISATEHKNLSGLVAQWFRDLNLIRVYTKAPGHEADKADPVVLRVDATIEDAAREIHKDFASNLQYAKIWGSHTFDAQRVQRDYVLHDGDIIEFHV